MILRGVFVFFIRRGYVENEPWSISLMIEDLVVSYTSKVEIPVSSYL